MCSLCWPPARELFQRYAGTASTNAIRRISIFQLPNRQGKWVRGAESSIWLAVVNDVLARPYHSGPALSAKLWWRSGRGSASQMQRRGFDPCTTSDFCVPSLAPDFHREVGSVCLLEVCCDMLFLLPFPLTIRDSFCQYPKSVEHESLCNIYKSLRCTKEYDRFPFPVFLV